MHKVLNVSSRQCNIPHVSIISSSISGELVGPFRIPMSLNIYLRVVSVPTMATLTRRSETLTIRAPATAATRQDCMIRSIESGSLRRSSSHMRQTLIDISDTT